VSNREKYTKLKEEWEKWCTAGRKFVGKMVKGDNGLYIVEINQNKEVISIKYDIGNGNEQIFTNFLKLTI
jgi:hypothetical protein